jgi:hypothetical protein
MGSKGKFAFTTLPQDASTSLLKSPLEKFKMARDFFSPATSQIMHEEQR